MQSRNVGFAKSLFCWWGGVWHIAARRDAQAQGPATAATAAAAAAPAAETAAATAAISSKPSRARDRQLPRDHLF